MQSAKAVCFMLLLLWKIPQHSDGLPKMIHIGGLFDTEDDEQEMVFRYAVDSINNDPSILPTSQLKPQVKRMEPNDSYRASKIFCEVLHIGIAAAFGPQSEQTSMHVQSICDALEVPHVVSRWEYRLQRDDLSVNLHPHPTTLSQAFIKLIDVWSWKKFYYVYEENEGAIRLQDIMKESVNRKWTIKVFQLDDESSYRSVFWDIKKNSMPLDDKTVTHRIILDVPRTSLYQVLKAAQQVGMMTEKQHYIVTCLDLHATDLEDFQFGKTNMTGLRLIQEDNPEFQQLLHGMNKLIKQRRNFPPLKTLKTESALMYDMVKLFALALESMDIGTNVNEFPPVSCNTMEKGSDGTSLVNYMKSAKMSGVTGQVEFDAEGFRSMLSLDIMYLTEKGLEKIGTMVPRESINITKGLAVKSEFTELENRCYTLTAIKNNPFMMLKESSEKLSGNARYEGYIVDLMDELSKRLRFSYKIRLVNDSKYGEDLGNRWNGMIGEVMTGVADFAAADLTINSKREAVVDFTMPFMNTGISILFKKPTEKATTLFSFFDPFSAEVWMYVIACYMSVSLILFVAGRLSPYEWSNPHPCRQDDLVEENAFTVLNSMWFTIGSFMQQGSDLSPTAISTRTIASIWYFFNLIMISSYTANLAAFLTIEKTVYPIENAKDLLNQERIKYGCLGSGSTKGFFQNSEIHLYREMYKVMMRNQEEVFMPKNTAGKQKVLEGNYAYFAEVSFIRYIVERECEFVQIGDRLDSKSYGIAVKKGNTKLSAWLSSGILKLQEAGLLHDYKEKWWKQKKGGGKCKADSSGTVKDLGLGNVGGVFVVMMLGMTLAVVVAVLEFMWFSRKIERTKQDNVFKMLLQEVQMAISCGTSEKSAPKMKTKENKKSVP